MAGLAAAVEADAQQGPVVLGGEPDEGTDPVAAEVIDLGDDVAPGAEHRDAGMAAEDLVESRVGAGPDLHGGGERPGGVALGDRPVVHEDQSAEAVTLGDEHCPFDVLADVVGGSGLGLARVHADDHQWWQRRVPDHLGQVVMVALDDPAGLPDELGQVDLRHVPVSPADLDEHIPSGQGRSSVRPSARCHRHSSAGECPLVRAPLHARLVQTSSARRLDPEPPDLVEV